MNPVEPGPWQQQPQPPQVNVNINQHVQAPMMPPPPVVVQQSDNTIWVVHAVLCVLTCGAWLPILIIHAIVHACTQPKATVAPPVWVPPQPPPMTGNQAAIADLQYRAAKRGEARALAAAQPMMARELGIGRRDIPQRQFDDGGLIDVNHVPAQALTAFTGVTPEFAARIVECREHLGPNGYTSVEELMAQADLPPHLIEEIREYAIFL